MIDSLVLDNVKITNTGGSNNQSITIGGNQSELTKLILSNCNINANNDGYPIITFNPCEINIEKSYLAGYCGVYFKGSVSSEGSHGSNLIADKTEFDCPNVHNGDTNDFGVFTFEDDDIDISLDDCNINASVEGLAKQSVFLLSSYSHNQIDKLNLSISGDSIVNGEIITNSWTNGCYALNISGGTYTSDPSDYVDNEKYEVIYNSAFYKIQNK